MTQTISPQEKIIRQAIGYLVNADYQALVSLDVAKVVSAADLQQAVDSYGQQLVDPPQSGWWELVTFIPVTSAGFENCVYADVPLWTSGEGRSDLELQLQLKEVSAEKYELHILDLLVP